MKRIGLFLAAVALVGCDQGTYTLYRTGYSDHDLGQENSDRRIPVATFDAEDTANYNQQTCERARRLFQDEPRPSGINVRYWCEKGRYRK